MSRNRSRILFYVLLSFSVINLKGQVKDVGYSIQCFIYDKEDLPKKIENGLAGNISIRNYLFLSSTYLEGTFEKKNIYCCDVGKRHDTFDAFIDSLFFNKLFLIEDNKPHYRDFVNKHCDTVERVFFSIDDTLPSIVLSLEIADNFYYHFAITKVHVEYCDLRLHPQDFPWKNKIHFSLPPKRMKINYEEVMTFVKILNQIKGVKTKFVLSELNDLGEE